MLQTPFDKIELEIRSQLARMLGPGGFDHARDILAITVNRWPHGYAYTYDTVGDPDMPSAERPHVQKGLQDFSLGTWGAYEGDKKSATADLEKVLNGCAIQETWSPLEKTREQGIGLFTYSRMLGHWGYFWVADIGQATDFSGDQVSSNDMLYVTFAPLPNGAKKERHWTLKLQPDGTIQELSVASTDGKTWYKEYELTWKHGS